MQRNPVQRPRSRAHRALSTALLLSVAAVVLLHAGLLWQRFDDQSIARPEVAVRWIAAAAIAVAALLLRHAPSGSRKSWIAFWAIVALLHLAGPGGAVLTQAVLAAAPLLLALIALASSAVWIGTTFVDARNSGPTLAASGWYASDRAPPLC